MTRIGTPGAAGATRMMLLGSGELGKEVAIEAQRFGVEVIAVDRYPGAPAMQVAHRSHVVNMLDGDALAALVAEEDPALIVPEIEAIATATLLELEAAGRHVVPTARAAHLTMNREGIRRLAAEELSLPTSSYRFADDEAGYRAAVEAIGLPCVVKPVMSSSGKGQSTVRGPEQVQAAWDYSQQGGRTGSGRVIVEGFVAFDYEITLLTLRHGGRHQLLRADRPSADRRRLPRILAAAPDVGRRAGPCAGDRRRGDRCTRRYRHLRRGAVRAGRSRSGSARSRRVRTTPGW